MSTRSSLQKAASALAIAAMLSGCASSASNRSVKAASDFRDKKVDVGMATKALAALNANDFAHAVEYGEKAVAQSPRDAGFRTLLGNAYFGAGRFASAEQAFRDSLALYPSQAQVMLKLALVEISLGKTAEALELVEYAREGLDPADYGLAVALAGRASDAIPVLQAAAASAASNPRVRQNLALAYGLAGDWTNARVVASQDVAPNELDARVQQWMELAAYGSKPAVRVAALTGVTPNLADPGQPVALAIASPLEKGTAVAAAAAPTPVEEPGVAYAPPPPPPYAAPEAAPAVVAASAPVAEASEPQQGSITVKLPEAAPVPEAAPAIAAAAPSYVPPALSAAQFPYVEVKRSAKGKKNASAPAQPKRAPVTKAAAVKPKLPVRQAALKTGNAGVVVQLGAYASSASVAKAWNAASRKYTALGGYVPVSASVKGPKGNFYRLSVRGFANPAEAAKVCGQVRKSGGACFVRGVAGDRPVNIASR